MEQTDFKNVLTVFAHYGFKKASMEDLAQAADISRQTLYNRFKTKQAVLDWAVEGYVKLALEQALAELKDESFDPVTCLLKAFSRWIGDIIPLMHGTPHGSEVMDLGTDTLMRSDIDPHAEFESEINKFLLHRAICKTQVEADDKTFLLHMSSKGLMLKSGTSEEFEAGMLRILQATIHNPAIEQS